MFEIGDYFGFQTTVLDVTDRGEKPTCPACGEPLQPWAINPDFSSSGEDDRDMWLLWDFAHDIPKCTLQRHEDRDELMSYVGELGAILNAKYGFGGMQYVWQMVYHMNEYLGNAGGTMCSVLTSQWDGIGHWRA